MTTDEKTTESPKYKLTQFCVDRGLNYPMYLTKLHGQQHDPSWVVTVNWGDESYTTPEPRRAQRQRPERPRFRNGRASSSFSLLG